MCGNLEVQQVCAELQEGLAADDRCCHTRFVVVMPRLVAAMSSLKTITDARFVLTLLATGSVGDCVVVSGYGGADKEGGGLKKMVEEEGLSTLRGWVAKEEWKLEKESYGLLLHSIMLVCESV